MCTELRKKLVAAGETLVRVFHDFDKDGSLTLSFDELRTGLSRYGIKLSDDEFGSLFRDVDRDASGELSWDEFSTWLGSDDEYATEASRSTAAVAANMGKETHKPRVQPMKAYAKVSTPPLTSSAPPTAIGASWLSGGGAQQSLPKRGW